MADHTDGVKAVSVIHGNSLGLFTFQIGLFGIFTLLHLLSANRMTGKWR